MPVPKASVLERVSHINNEEQGAAFLFTNKSFGHPELNL